MKNRDKSRRANAAFNARIRRRRMDAAYKIARDFAPPTLVGGRSRKIAARAASDIGGPPQASLWRQLGAAGTIKRESDGLNAP